MSIVCIIPARGGSKGIPNKNITTLAGRPLVVWSIERALQTESIGKNVFVSSDSRAILDVAEKFGAKGIERPEALSGDTATSESALQHALKEIQARWVNDTIEYVVFLQPTSPLRKPDDIERAILHIQETGADSLLSVQPLKDYFIWQNINGKVTSVNFDYKKRKRRQDIETTYLENGSIYIFKPSVLFEMNNRLGGEIVTHEMDKIHSIQIDEHEDLLLCEYFLKRMYS